MLEPRKVTGIEYFLAIGVRFALLHSSFKASIHDRVEISTPLNSFKRLKEGIHLFNQNVDPYSGDLFHETPLILTTVRLLLEYLGSWIEVVYVAIDVFVAFLLYKTAIVYAESVKKKEDEKLKKGIYCKDSKNFMITECDTKSIPAFVAYAYLFNPYIIFNCVGLTTTIFDNLFLAGVFYSMVKRHKITSVFLLSLVTLKSFYPFTLIVPICFQFYKPEKQKRQIFEVVVLYIISFCSLLGLCYWLSGSWQFVDSTFGFILNANDLTPNIGLFWYFFTEMFEHFRALFISSLQINATILYLLPLTLHFKKDPVFLSFTLIALSAVFKFYPSLGDVGFYLSLLPLWKPLFFFMQQSFNIFCILVITSVLGPTVWHLWIYSGSANANFYFGVTLAFATAQIFLLTDILLAHKRRSFALKNGFPDESSDSALVFD